MSHGDHDGHRQVYEKIRRAADEAGRSIAILADLAGPKIRVGEFRNGQIDLTTDQRVIVTTRNCLGEPGLIPSQYGALGDDVGPGARILLADGVMELRVERVADTEIHLYRHPRRCIGESQGHQPSRRQRLRALPDRQRQKDAKFMLDLGVDFLGLSFVRRATDIEELRALITGLGKQAAIVAKIERPEALVDSTAIIAASDAIMVARGDLGVELPPEQVPIAQRQLVDDARRCNTPVIVATQMLESMVEVSRPTRAEVSDVAHTVLSGADAIMLSAETASGAHPILAVEMMNRIARHSEAYLWEQEAFGASACRKASSRPFRSVTPWHVRWRNSPATCGCGPSSRFPQSGMSAATMSSARPAAPVVSISSSSRTCRLLSMMWGIIPYLARDDELHDGVELARRLAVELKLAKTGDFVLLVRGFHADHLKTHPSITLVGV